MNQENIRYSASIPLTNLNKLKDLVKEKKIPSINYAINEALNDYLKLQKSLQYESLMQSAGKDDGFLTRTLKCCSDFEEIDREGLGSW